MAVERTEGGGVEPQWLMPLGSVTGRVQYPLATPSRRALPVTTEVSVDIEFTCNAPRYFRGTRLKEQNL